MHFLTQTGISLIIPWKKIFKIRKHPFCHIGTSYLEMGKAAIPQNQSETLFSIKELFIKILKGATKVLAGKPLCQQTNWQTDPEMFVVIQKIQISNVFHFMLKHDWRLENWHKNFIFLDFYCFSVIVHMFHEYMTRIIINQ